MLSSRPFSLSFRSEGGLVRGVISVSIWLVGGTIEVVGEGKFCRWVQPAHWVGCEHIILGAVEMLPRFECNLFMQGPMQRSAPCDGRNSRTDRTHDVLPRREARGLFRWWGRFRGVVARVQIFLS